jgi:hypothetical protein
LLQNFLLSFQRQHNSNLSLITWFDKHSKRSLRQASPPLSSEAGGSSFKNFKTI